LQLSPAAAKSLILAGVALRCAGFQYAAMISVDDLRVYRETVFICYDAAVDRRGAHFSICRNAPMISLNRTIDIENGGQAMHLAHPWNTVVVFQPIIWTRTQLTTARTSRTQRSTVRRLWVFHG
jgi:hypothetical protein